MKQRFRQLKIWQRSIDINSNIYELTKDLPKTELFGLTSQIRRASVSISLNIAEGSGSNSNKEFNRFLNMSLRSAYEVISALEIVKRLKYLNEVKIDSVIAELDEIIAMIYVFSKKLK